MEALFFYYSSLNVLTSSTDAPDNLINNVFSDVLNEYLAQSGINPEGRALAEAVLTGVNRNPNVSFQQALTSIFRDSYVRGISSYAIKAYLCFYIRSRGIIQKWPIDVQNDINGATCDMLDELLKIEDFSLYIIWSCAAYVADFETYYRQKHGRSLFSNLSAEHQQTFSDYRNR